MLIWSAHHWTLNNHLLNANKIISKFNNKRRSTTSEDNNNNNDKMSSKRDIIDEEVEDQITSVSTYLKAIKSNPTGMSFPTGSTTAVTTHRPWRKSTTDGVTVAGGSRFGRVGSSSRFTDDLSGSLVNVTKVSLNDVGGGEPPDLNNRGLYNRKVSNSIKDIQGMLNRSHSNAGNSYDREEGTATTAEYGGGGGGAGDTMDHRRKLFGQKLSARMGFRTLSSSNSSSSNASPVDCWPLAAKITTTTKRTVFPRQKLHQRCHRRHHLLPLRIRRKITSTGWCWMAALVSSNVTSPSWRVFQVSHIRIFLARPGTKRETHRSWPHVLLRVILPPWKCSLILQRKGLFLHRRCNQIYMSVVASIFQGLCNTINGWN